MAEQTEQNTVTGEQWQIMQFEARIAALEKWRAEVEAQQAGAKAAPGQTWKTPAFQRYEQDEDK